MTYGLRAQLALYIFLVTVVASALIAAVSVKELGRSAESQMLRKGLGLSAVVSETLVSPLYDLRIDQMARLVKHVLSDEDIMHAYIVDTEGYILSDGTDENILRDELLVDVFSVLQNSSKDIIHFLDNEKQTLLIFRPVMTASGEYLGGLIFELSLRQVVDLKRQTTMKILVISCIAIILGLMLAIFIAGRQIRPINLIKNATEKLATGDLNIRLNSPRRDELGELANAVDSMAKQLQGSTVSKEYINRIINSMPEGLMVLDESYHILSANPFADKLFGTPLNYLKDKSIEGLFFKKGESKCKLVLDVGEYEVRRGDHTIPVHLSLSNIEGANRKLETLLLIHDLTSRKLLEQEREQALEKAEESTRLKSEFLASMSHEIRTPMNGVIGLLRMLSHGDLSIQQANYVDLAKSSADSLLCIINDILDFSKIEAGKLDLEILEFNLRNLLTEFTALMAPRTKEKNLELVLDMEGVEKILVKGDPGRIRQILTNLVGNAIKFTASGEIRIHAQLVNTNKHDLQFKCAVVDSGIGIPTEKINSLTDSFTQADASTTRKYGGTGLGLAIVKQLCEKMGGKLTVTSEEGHGSCFEFSVCLKASVIAEDSSLVKDVVDHQKKDLQLDASPIDNVSPLGNLSSNTRLLLVEDVSINQIVAQAILGDFGLSADVAGNGIEAIDALRSAPEDAPYQLVFMDCQMPEMDGYEATRQIRAGASGPRNTNIPIIAMTANAMKGDKEHCLDVGMNDYISKPIEASIVLEKLQTWLPKAKQILGKPE